MIVNFTKMHSLGNDFVVIDGITQNIKLHRKCIQQLADRKTGIGCDQLLVLEPPKTPDVDFYYRIYNADGKEAEQCLNGARCTARFAQDSGLINKEIIIANCLAGKISFTINNNQSVISQLECFNHDITEIDLNLTANNILPTNFIGTYQITVGNPHVIYLLDWSNNEQQPPLTELYQTQYALLAQQISNHDKFPNGINIGFGIITANKDIYLRVFERGTGETLSCGSNAMATFLVANKLTLINTTTKIIFKLGFLSINLDNDNNLFIDGPTNSVFSGKFKI